MIDRAICPVCHNRVRTRVDGSIGSHKVLRGEIWSNSETAYIDCYVLCEGTYQYPRIILIEEST